MIHSYFIGEVKIPNSQRYGNIPSVIESEIQSDVEQITSEGYRRIMISEDKTGSLQTATVSVYLDVFHELIAYISYILPKIHALTIKILFTAIPMCFTVILGVKSVVLRLFLYCVNSAGYLDCI